MSTTHRLKVDRKYWPAIIDGRKSFEVRRNDRDFQTGDIIEMHPIDDVASLVSRRITYVLHTFPEGLQPGYVVLGLTP